MLEMMDFSLPLTSQALRFMQYYSEKSILAKQTYLSYNNLLSTYKYYVHLYSQQQPHQWCNGSCHDMADKLLSYWH
jgi:hypothetical protein